jgi:Cu-Zn family superoxide dismutase
MLIIQNHHIKQREREMSLFRRSTIAVLFLGLVSTACAAKTIEIELFQPDGKVVSAGSVTMTDTSYGLLITPDLKGLPAGLHGFHIHEHASCEDHGMAASGHLDPKKTNKHLGPYDKNGHLGDLPILIVDTNGNATIPAIAPKLKTRDIANHALMVHEGGDNYSDEPEKLGGGGARIACGVIK